jgi:hypothetical protein
VRYIDYNFYVDKVKLSLGYGRRGIAAIILNLRRKIEVSGEAHAPVDLIP